MKRRWLRDRTEGPPQGLGRPLLPRVQLDQRGPALPDRLEQVLPEDSARAPRGRSEPPDPQERLGLARQGRGLRRRFRLRRRSRWLALCRDRR